MTKKIFRSIFLVATAVLLACFALIMGALYEHYGSVQKEQLKTELTLTAEAVERGGVDYLRSLEKTDCRLTLVSADGNVLYDSETDASKMENHADREEIAMAMKTGFGESSRYSSTLTEQTVYYAKKLSDGSVLRVSMSRATALMLILSMLQPLVFIFILALVLSGLLANRLAKKIVEPLNSLDLDTPLENKTYDEISPLLTHIERQQQMIRSQKKELESRKSEFYAVIKNMSEGLLLLGADLKIISINPAAEAFFGVQDCVGRDFIEIERGRAMREAIEAALSRGHGELETARNGREYQINAGRIDDDGKPSGIVVLIFDVTEKVFAERNRREFTANVSHELKTPLHSIMGSAELIENGMVDEKDMPRFVGHIRSEAARLVALIEDIIRLSQLDENAELPAEKIDVYDVACEEAQRLKDVANERGVELNVSGQSAEITGVRRLLHEISYNLIENAIKYNVEGGRVDVSVRTDGTGAVLTVADTGIGIPLEHQDRVFERFYRVDKSRSKQTGGTGLGLSIVKHAAQYMGAAIDLECTPGKGTTVTVRFK